MRYQSAVLPQHARALLVRINMQLTQMISALVPRCRVRARWLRIALTTVVLACYAGCQQPVQVRQAGLLQPELIPQPASPGSQPATPALAPTPQTVEPLGPPTPLTMPAQPEPPPDVVVLRLEDLEQIALMNNPSLDRAQALVASARGNWVQVGLPPNLSWGYLGQQLGSGNIASQHMFMVDGELVTGGKLRWNRAVAEQEILRAEQQLFAQQQRVLTDVRVAFYEALLAQRN